MRTLNQIQDIIKERFVSNTVLKEAYNIPDGQTFDDYFSLVAIERQIVNVISFALFVQEQLSDVFKKEIAGEIAASRVHTREWYRQKALSYLLGVPIIPGTDVFDTAALTEAEIESAKVIKQAATVKLISAAGYGILRVKVASKSGNSLVPVPQPAFDSFKQYMNRHVVDAGTQMVITTGIGDDVRLTVDIYYDPLVISAQGTYLTDGTDVALPAVQRFLSSIEFNGRLILSDLERYLRELPGVDIAVVKSAASKYGSFSYDTQNIQNVGAIDQIRIADSGYFVLDESETQINYRLTDE